MNLIEPQRTDWDLQFYVADIPVRVHPMFWLMSLFVIGIGETMGIEIVIGVLVVFLSILIHELGHAFTMRYYGERARVVLYFMGGLAIPGGENAWDLGYRKSARSPASQMIISAAGPAAGFLLAGLTAAIIYGTGGQVLIDRRGFVPLLYPYYGDFAISPAAAYALYLLLFVNIYWGVLNLLPVFPMDGGQIARQIFLVQDPWEGLSRSLWLSVFVGGGMAAFGLLQGDIWIAVLFGSMAFSSWQALQNTGAGGRPW